MANLTKVGYPSMSSVLPSQSDSVVGLFAGETIAVGDLVYIASDGTVMRCNGTSANAAAKCRGIAFVGAVTGDPITIWNDINVRYGSGLTPGADLYVSATAGAIADGATTGGTAPIGYVVDATRIHVYGSRY